MNRFFSWFISLFKEEKQPEIVKAPDAVSEPIVEVVKPKAKPKTKAKPAKKEPAKKAPTTKKPSGTAAPKKPAVKKTKGK